MIKLKLNGSQNTVENCSIPTVWLPSSLKTGNDIGYINSIISKMF